MDYKRQIFVDTLTQPFSDENYLAFLKELLNDITLSNGSNKEIKPYNTFSSIVDHYKHIGYYTGEDGNKVALFSVCLNNEKRVESARSMQRSFVKSLLDSSTCTGALVAFYTKNDPDKWRLSLVRVDYEFSKGKISEKLSPAKRYSYLVGKGEPCHTAQEQLFPVFLSTGNPSLDELERVFGVESVTDEFFKQYREKYLDLKEYLDNNQSFVQESQSRGFDSEQFAKKLMGQIVFLYFIQKKGWLGVSAFPAKLKEQDYKSGFYRPGQKPKILMEKIYKKGSDGMYHRDTEALQKLSPEDEEELSKCVKGDPWGSGPKDFMRQIFIGCKNRGMNFFNDYLEPLFYTGLNQNRGENAFFSPLHRRIPFLNGGLFEELDGYDWRNNNFEIPDEMFSDIDVKGKDEADGILDIFDRFNFTIAEDEPMEREVAIDPEMLGKVFENLLDVKDKKSKGAFYTPREIVHFMCQESLIGYLVNRTGIPDDDIRKFILYGEYFRDEDARKTLKVDNATGKPLLHDIGYATGFHMEIDKEKDMEIPESIFSYKKNVDRLQEIDGLLANVKVVDIAVGSGAFPLGMLTEIIKARETVTTYMCIEKNDRQRLLIHSRRNPYTMKRETIKNCIFGCDIEPSATDISKLRLWLSLVIDNLIMDEENDELGYSTKPRELPNLDCNIVCGDSLMDRFKGIQLITENSVLNNEKEGRQITAYDESIGRRINDLIDLQSKLYDENNHVAKESLKKQIQDIYNEIVLEQLELNSKTMDEYYQAISKPSQPFILWQLYFPKVFRDNGGFDIVIGNPPYIRLQSSIDNATGEKLGDKYKKIDYDTYTKNADIYCLFFEKGYDLLCKDGILAYITSNKWLRAEYGENLRKLLAENTNPLYLVDFGGQKIFKSATVGVDILIFEKAINKHKTKACIACDANLDDLSSYTKQNSIEMSFDSSDNWVILSSIESQIRQKIENKGTPLRDWNIRINRGVVTGYNGRGDDGVFIINGNKRKELIDADKKSEEVIRPILRGKDIRRYGYDFADMWIVYIPWHFPLTNMDYIFGASNKAENAFKESYPAVYNHLYNYKDRLSKRNQAETGIRYEWYALQRYGANYMEDFSKPKLVWTPVNSDYKFCLIYDEMYFINSVFMITGEDIEVLCANLNSKLFRMYLMSVLSNGNYEYGSKEFFLTVPVLRNSTSDEKLASLAKELSESGGDSVQLMSEIDAIIYSNYDLTSDEIAYIENVFKD